jgi:hypothetical protein
VIGLTLLLLASQAGAPEVTATADRYRLMVGEELVYTVTAVSPSDLPMRLEVTSLYGFEVIGRTESRQVSFTPVSRTTVLELRLRAVRAGKFPLGPIEARQGNEVASIPGLTVEVTESRGAVAAAINPRVGALLRRATPPALAGEVGLTVHLSADTVLVGEQIDVVTAAWFPRELRLRLRRPPTLQPPSVDGLWSYPQPAPVGIAASRRVEGSWYDLFVGHEIVFPLTPGTFELEPASLRYSVPLALQFFSQEERLSLESDVPVVVVKPLPVEGRPADFRGAVGQSLTAAWEVPEGPGTVGDPLPVEFTVSGIGNVALWPDPDPDWPEGARLYRDGVAERHRTERGSIGGEKSFTYLVVPTEAGTLTIPAVRYVFYDLRARRYETITVAAREVPVASGGQSLAARALPPPLLEGTRRSASARLAEVAWQWWLLVFGTAPLAYLVAHLVRRRRGRPRHAKRRIPSDLRSAELEFERLIRLYVPDFEDHVGSALVTALMVAGLDDDTARRVGTVRGQLMFARYGPEAGPAADHGSLVREVKDIVEHLATIPQATLRHRAVAVGVAALLAAVGAPVTVASAQDVSPMELYQDGALTLARSAFADQAGQQPGVVAHWYNLGATHYRLGNDWRAATTWRRALTLEPRNRHVKRALELVPAPDPVSARRAMVIPVTGGEFLAVAAILWLVGWGGLAWGRRARRRWIVSLLLAVVAVAGAGLVYWWEGRPRATVLADATLQVSPHERAPSLGPVTAGTVVWLGTHRGGWVLVRGPREAQGWLPVAALAMSDDYLSHP